MVGHRRGDSGGRSPHRCGTKEDVSDVTDVGEAVGEPFQVFGAVEGGAEEDAARSIWFTILGAYRSHNVVLGEGSGRAMKRSTGRRSWNGKGEEPP